MPFVACPSCSAVYERAVRIVGTPASGQFQCDCGHVLAQWRGWQTIEFKRVANGVTPAVWTRRGSRKPDSSIMILDVLTGGSARL